MPEVTDQERTSARHAGLSEPRQRLNRTWASIERRWGDVPWRGPHAARTPEELCLVPVTAAAEIIWLARRGMRITNPTDGALPAALLDILLNMLPAVEAEALVIDTVFAVAGAAPFERWILGEASRADMDAVEREQRLRNCIAGLRLEVARDPDDDPGAPQTQSQYAFALLAASGALTGRNGIHRVLAHTVTRLREYTVKLAHTL